ncbi:MAG: O-acetyl-ADP-ribose deacetylase [Bacilli bacterium]|nr:O-acetyl-ADP-ribose deacetylase [Bacilli bacterium]
MIVEVILGDITKLGSEVEAIVNAANEDLLGGGGVDGAIHRAAGPELLKECCTLGGCEPGDAKVSKAYNLKQKYIIHTVGPRYYSNPNPAETLRSCYQKSLQIADKLGVKTIAFPSISTGVFRYPLEEASSIAINTIKQYKSKNIETVIICAFDEKTYKVYLDKLR